MNVSSAAERIFTTRGATSERKALLTDETCNKNKRAFKKKLCGVYKDKRQLALTQVVVHKWTNGKLQIHDRKKIFLKISCLVVWSKWSTILNSSNKYQFENMRIDRAYWLTEKVGWGILLLCWRTIYLPAFSEI